MPIGTPVTVRILLAVACFAFQGCASMPLATMARMSTFDESEFAILQPEQLGVRIRIPDGFSLDVGKSWLGIEIGSTKGVHDARFELGQVSLLPVPLPGGLFSGSRRGLQYELRLTRPSESRFRDLQTFVSQGKLEDVNIRVVPKLASSPSDATSVPVWIDLRLSTQEGYFALVDDASIALKRLSPDAASSR